MLPRERLETIKQIAIKEKKVYVSKLSEKLNVTEETIRRDLDKLEGEGMLIRSHGGAILNADNKLCEENYSTNKLEISMENIKSMVERTIEFVKEGSTILADCSLLTLEVLKLIKNRYDVTVITNSIRVLNELDQSNLNLILTGGNINAKTQSLQGTIMQEVIKNYNVDIALVNCNGIDIENGISESNEIEAEIKRTMIRQAKEVILLADESIFDTTSLVTLFNYKDIDYIVTNREPRKEWLKLFELYNIECIY